MRKILAIISVSALFSGCCTMTDGAFCKDNFNSAACGADVIGYTHTLIAYGDSTMVVLPISQIQEDTEWRFLLAPVTLSSDPVDYRDATVTITGKTGFDAWINTAGPNNDPDYRRLHNRYDAYRLRKRTAEYSGRY